MSVFGGFLVYGILPAFAFIGWVLYGNYKKQCHNYQSAYIRAIFKQLEEGSYTAFEKGRRYEKDCANGKVSRTYISKEMAFNGVDIHITEEDINTILEDKRLSIDLKERKKEELRGDAFSFHHRW